MSGWSVGLARNLIHGLTLLIAIWTSSLASAQGGYTTEKYPEHGLKLSLARDYKWLAVQPNEQWVILQWINTKLSVPSRMQILRIDDAPDTGPPMPDESGELPPAQPLIINSWYRYLDQRLPDWSTELLDTGGRRDGFKGREFELSRGVGRSERGWAYVWENRSLRTFVVLGWAATEHYESQRKIWRRTAEKLRFSEPAPDPRVKDWRRFYAARPRLLDPEYRIRVRAALEGSWKSEDTDHYIVIFNTKDKPLVSRIVRDLESVRKEYMRLFPPAAEIKAVSTVRICADEREYLNFGGAPGTRGYWSAETEELVLYDSTVRERAKSVDKGDTLVALYHEAFHQFIHYSAGELAPHSWFDEGFGDYFGGAYVQGGAVQRVGFNPWRIESLRRSLASEDYTPWREFFLYERANYYGARITQSYAQGWSMIYFLMSSRVVRQHDTWSGILNEYFRELKDAWDNEMGVLRGDGTLDDADKVEAAQRRARQRALDAALDGVDVEELESAWFEFARKL